MVALGDEPEFGTLALAANSESVCGCTDTEHGYICTASFGHECFGEPHHLAYAGPTVGVAAIWDDDGRLIDLAHSQHGATL